MDLHGRAEGEDHRDRLGGEALEDVAKRRTGSETGSKRLDIVRVESGDAGTVDKAICVLKGDTLTVVMTMGGGKRPPKDFASPPKEGTGIIVFERVKKK